MTEREFVQRLGKRAKRAAVAVDRPLAAKLWIYLDLLFRWNTKINLTSHSLHSPDAAIDRLLLEPLVAARQFLATERTFIDVGSGGGSPALPMHLASGARLVMVESKARKSAFLREAVRQLECLATVETARFEELLTRPEFHESFDVLTIRAVRTESRTLAGLQAVVRPGGRMFLFRSVAGRPDLSGLMPPLRRAGTVPLLAGSELALLEKLNIP